MSAAGHVVERLPELVLGALPPSERARDEEHLAACDPCAREHDALAAALAALADAPPAVAPSPSVRARIIDATRSVSRFSDFLERVARFLDLSSDRARALLDRLDDASAWRPRFPGVACFVPEHGPALAGATIGVLRVEPGARFPHHRHGGDEEVLVLQGGMRGDDGRSWHAGMIQAMAAGTEHGLVGLGPPACLCIGVVRGLVQLRPST
jgi:anti-sigma factor ChrR (cupin superfamily)